MSTPTAVAVRAEVRGRLSVAAELTRSGALRRAVRWEPAAVGCVAGAALLAWRHDAAAPVDVLRGVSLVVVLGLLFVLDDQAARTVAAVPVMWRHRLALRLLVALAIAGPAFVVLCGVLMPGASTGSGAGLEVATLLCVGMAAAAVAFRYFGVDEPGLVAGPVTLGVVGLLAFVPTRWALLVTPGPDWAAAHLRWAGLLVVAAALLLVASRDPGARRRAVRGAAAARR